MSRRTSRGTTRCVGVTKQGTRPASHKKEKPSRQRLPMDRTAGVLGSTHGSAKAFKGPMTKGMDVEVSEIPFACRESNSIRLANAVPKRENALLRNEITATPRVHEKRRSHTEPVKCAPWSGQSKRGPACKGALSS